MVKALMAILLTASLLIMSVAVMAQNVKAKTVFEATRGQDTPLAKYCTVNPKSGPCQAPSTAGVADLGIAEIKKLKQEIKSITSNNDQCLKFVTCNLPSSIINSSTPSTSTTGDFETQEITKFSNEAAALKTDISSATFTPGNGIVKELINKVEFFSGEVSVIGGGTWTILYGVEDALISKIKESGPSSFSADEQSYLAEWVDRAMQNRKEHPDFGSQIFNNPGFDLNQRQGESTLMPQTPPEQQPSIIRTGCPDGYHISPSGDCERN